jgi:hypothetical protein
VAIVLSVTDPRTQNAPFVIALKLPRLAGIVAAIKFIRAIDAIPFTVAFPSRRYAVIVGETTKISRTTGVGEASGTVPFIRAVSAIILKVATPLSRDATSVIAAEVLAGARRIVASRFVAVVAAVVLKVASPMRRNATAVGALELRVAAGRLTAVHLIRFIDAIVVPVAPPQVRDAEVGGTGALEESGRTRLIDE